MGKKSTSLCCPFCGKEVKILKLSTDVQPEGFSLVSGTDGYVLTHEAEDNINCPIATLSGEMLGSLVYESEQEAIDIWNNRSAK